MINKKNLLGKTPDALGIKDAIHTAIVSVRAGGPIDPGQRCGLNANREAVPNKNGCGVADPFRKGTIIRGQPFWLLLCQDEVPNVQHVWEHPSVDFTPPSGEVKRNSTLQKFADAYGVTYEQLMDSVAYVVEHDWPAKYPGAKTHEEFSAVKYSAEIDEHELWGEWANETNHEFYNNGSECCPEFSYPDCDLFAVPASQAPNVAGNQPTVQHG